MKLTRFSAIKSIMLFGSLVLLPGHIDAQSANQKLRQSFMDPPSEFRPLIITHARYAENPDLIDWLEERRVGGTVLDGGVRKPKDKEDGEEMYIEPTYLNDPKVFDQMRGVMAELKHRGHEIWIYDELGYPSPSAAGRVLDGYPEFQVWAMSCKTFEAEGKQIKVEVIHPQVFSCVAMPRVDNILASDQAVDLTEQALSGSFEWSPPEGDWVVCLYEKHQPDTWRRHNIPRRNVNIMDREAIARFIELTHERYAEELGPQLQDVTLFFTDEPQFGATEHWTTGAIETAPAVQWCDELPGFFAGKKGYPVTRALYALFHDVGPETSRYRFDFYDVQSDLVAENYYGQIQDWCHENGVWSSGHMLLEESLLLHVMWSGSAVKNWSRMDLPGVDLLRVPRYKTMAGWERDIVTVKEDFSCKMAASMARLNGKPGVFTESYAVTQDGTVEQAKGVAAWQFATGVTHMSTYTIQNQFTAEEFADFADFAGRLALMSRRGKPVSDIAVLVPEASVWAAYNPPDGGLFERYLVRNPEAVHIDHVFRETCHQLLEHQLDFEIFSEELLNRANISNGKLKLSGQSFSMLVLPEVRMLNKATLNKVRAYHDAGGHVVFIGSLPSQNPLLGEDASMMQEATELTASGSGRIRHMPDLGKFEELMEWVMKEIPSNVKWEGPSTVRITQRQDEDQSIIMVANPSAEDALGSLITNFQGEVSLWDAETGKVKAIDKRKNSNTIEVKVPANSARFLVFMNNN